MKIINSPRVMSISLSALFTCAAFLFSAANASAHGYISSPKSRVLICKENDPASPTLPACIAAREAGNNGFYEPQGVQIYGALDNHQQLIPDGKLCSIGRSDYAGLDLVRDDWPTTLVDAGVREFVWTNTAQVKTRYFRYYITKEGFNPATTPLKWSDLELIHDSGPANQEAVSRHLVNLPHRTGKHIVYSIWQRDWQIDAAEAFYQCVDVEFRPTSSTSSSSSRSSSHSSSSANNICANLPVWSATAVYTRSQQVQYNNKRYSANYWTRGNNPERYSAPYDHWSYLGSCEVTSSSSRTSSSAPASRSSSSTSSPLPG